MGGNTRQEQAQRTKAKIFDTAVSLIKAQGYDRVTVSQICQAAGIAKGSFYVHYRAKEDIVRESYYSDLDRYVREAYGALLAEHPDLGVVERIQAFLCAQLDFAAYAGYELTCLAYAMNLAACRPGSSDHFRRRPFSSILRELLEEAAPLLPEGFTQEEALSYLESVIRGVMATWCFSGGTYDLLGSGRKAAAYGVERFFQEGIGQRPGIHGEIV